MAALGSHACTLRSIRKLPALNRYSTVSSPKPVSQVE